MTMQWHMPECLCNQDQDNLSTTTREWSEDLLESEEIGFLRRLPLDNQSSIEGLNFYMSHGNSSYFEGHPEPEDNYDLFNYDLILSGYSHKPYLRQIGEKRATIKIRIRMNRWLKSTSTFLNLINRWLEDLHNKRGVRKPLLSGYNKPGSVNTSAGPYGFKKILRETSNPPSSKFRNMPEAVL